MICQNCHPMRSVICRMEMLPSSEGDDEDSEGSDDSVELMTRGR